MITGANGGLEAEFVRQATARGARRVYATARKPRAWDDERVIPLALDVTDTASIADAVSAAGDTTIVINNAGGSSRQNLLVTPLDEVRAAYETNVFGPIAVTQAFAPVLAKNGGGALIDIHSALSWLATPGAYSSTKAALWSVTNSPRLEFAAQGTQVVGAHLGYTDTPMTAGLDGQGRSPRHRRRDLRRPRSRRPRGARRRHQPLGRAAALGAADRAVPDAGDFLLRVITVRPTALPASPAGNPCS